MTQVSKDEFYKTIGPLDVVVRIIGTHPKTVSSFELRNRTVIGKVEPVLNEYGNTKYPIEDKYFLNR